MDRYKYTVEMKYINTKTNKSSEIKGPLIKSIIIDYDYDNSNMPVIYITASLDRNFIDLLITTREYALMNLKISKFVYQNDSIGILTENINQQFIYFMTDSVNYNQELDYSGANADRNDLSKVVSIGLIAKTNVSNNSKSFNGILNNTTMLGAIQYCTNHIPNLVFEPLNYNGAIKNLIIPQISTVSKALAFLNSVAVFYKTSYRFFLDFNSAYIVSSSGKEINKKGETISSILIIIKKSGEEAGIQQGMATVTKQKFYQVNIAATDTTVSKNNLTENLLTNIECVSVSGTTTKTKVNVNNSSYTSDKTSNYRVYNDNVNKINNIKADTESFAITLLINKNDLDGSIFNINKMYQIRNYDKYSNKDGKFLLSRKREIYIREDETFRMNTMLNFRQITS